MTVTPDLRERRRLATQAEIEEVALDLFARHGSDRTTVDDIASAAGVSPRTFFRYFATKEDAALGASRAFDAAVAARVEALVGRGAALRDFEDVIAEVLAEMAAAPGSIDRMLRVRCLVMDDAGLRSALLRLDAEQSRAFFRRIATATGSPTVDLRTRVIAETLGAGLRAALDDWAWRREAGEDADVVAIYRQTCAALREVAAG
ncbi:TetR family transcriptional regulator [Kineococcus rhizosphaerae]|uniref:TetR family transcriptional regulator n=1 Tax=Kineococcus rhizosphaerae TaxID=559628 RepID=A0A2T0R2P2_9ACTN|nr:TetR family transcriptional regulator [Kineococcus rhizosphaerae]PRY14045.1 TetR family transcriptional regulator [Kineococcus rhizosphaerae]